MSAIGLRLYAAYADGDRRDDAVVLSAEAILRQAKSAVSSETHAADMAAWAERIKIRYSEDPEKLEHALQEGPIRFGANYAETALRAGIDDHQLLAYSEGGADDYADLNKAYDHMTKMGGCSGLQRESRRVLGVFGCSKLICPFAEDPVVDHAKAILDGQYTLPASPRLGGLAPGEYVSCRDEAQ